jgi:hypothetical protein
MPLSARQRLSEVAQKQTRSGPPVWSAEDRQCLRKAYDRGKYKGAYAAFPDRHPRAVASAVRRYCLNPNVPADFVTPVTRSISIWKDPEFNRRFSAIAQEALCRNEIAVIMPANPKRSHMVGNRHSNES